MERNKVAVWVIVRKERVVWIPSRNKLNLVKRIDSFFTF